ncbi:MAG: arginine--tRNA ligase, partial [Clostridia bacterium]|nr:arginine--tRNA ligase [Clostridia bacterium]
MNIKSEIAALLESALPATTGLPSASEIETWLEIPPDSSLGDYAFPCFRLSKILRRSPPAIAAELATGIDAPGLVRAEAVSGYVNFFLNRESFARRVLLAVSPRYGASDEGNGKTVCLDYSSINIAKRFHIGHLSTTMIGHSLKRIYDYLGYKTIGINHLGDWGTQFGKMICAYKRWGSRAEIEDGGIDAMTSLYVRFHEEAKENPSLEDEGREWFRKIEEGDAEAHEIFGWLKEITLDDAERVYKKLGVHFDY